MQDCTLRETRSIEKACYVLSKGDHRHVNCGGPRREAPKKEMKGLAGGKVRFSPGSPDRCGEC